MVDNTDKASEDTLTAGYQKLLDDNRSVHLEVSDIHFLLNAILQLQAATFHLSSALSFSNKGMDPTFYITEANSFADKSLETTKSMLLSLQRRGMKLMDEDEVK